MNAEKKLEVSDPIPQLVDELADIDIDVDSLIPTMNVPKEMIEPEKECIVSDEKILGLYDEILKDCNKNEQSVDEVLLNFIDMVVNGGDASSASKEAVVNLLKIKSDIADKKAKVAELMTRIKLKERDTFPRYLAAQQNNKVVIEGGQREIIKTIQKIAQRKKNDK